MSHPPDVLPAMFCEHANEVPTWCQCWDKCYCRQLGNTCCRVTPVAENENVEPKPRKTIAERFSEFMQRNPHVYTEMVRLAREAKAAGRVRCGAKELWEVARWQIGLRTAGGEFKLDNTLCAPMARLIVENEPDIAHMFETRKRRAK